MREDPSQHETKLRRGRNDRAVGGSVGLLKSNCCNSPEFLRGFIVSLPVIGVWRGCVIVGVETCQNGLSEPWLGRAGWEKRTRGKDWIVDSPASGY